MEKEKDFKPMESWLNEYVKKNVAQTNKSQFKTFLAWVNKSPRQLVDEFDRVKTRSLLLAYQNHLLNERKLAQNTVRTYVNTCRAFYTSQIGISLKLKGKIVKQQLPKNEHIFSIEDLKAMFNISNVRDKAILSLAVSLGWESSAFLDIEKDFIERLIKRAKSQNQDFISFDWQRAKTSARIFGILTPMALFSCEQHIKKLDKENPQQTKLFNLTQAGLSVVLKKMVKESGIQTLGNVRFHLIRKFLMNALSDSGLNSFEVKLIVGKSISMSDLTYLQTLKKTAYRKYKKAYPSHLSLSLNVNGKAKYNELVDLVVKHVKAQEKLIEHMKAKGLLKKLPQDIETQLNTVHEFAKIMEKKNGKSKTESEKHD